MKDGSNSHHMNSPIFSSQEKVKNILSQYPDKRSATLPLLHLAQEKLGYLTSEAIKAIADLVGVHPGEIIDTISFYTMFYTKALGKYHIQICQTLPCSLNGADELVEHVCKKFQISPGDVTKDGKFSLTKVECLGSCDTAPVVRINQDYHEGVTQESLDDILNSLP